MNICAYNFRLRKKMYTWKKRNMRNSEGFQSDTYVLSIFCFRDLLTVRL